MALILIIIIFIIIRMCLLTNVITMHMIPMQQALSASMFRVYKCACVIFHVTRLMNTLMKMASNSRSNLCSC